MASRNASPSTGGGGALRDAKDPNNYRPISVLPILSKFLERHLHNHLYNYLNSNNLLYTRQSGFRRHYGTETALIRIIDQLLFSLDRNHVCGLVLIDYCKAFDMVDHQILMKKLRAYGMDIKSVKWLESYLSGRTQFVSFCGSKSDPLKSLMGCLRVASLAHCFSSFL